MSDIYQFPGVKALKKVYGEPKANAYLSLGWILINSGFDQIDNMFVYSLGWAKPEDPQYPSGEDNF